jgi:hypothetical protein
MDSAQHHKLQKGAAYIIPESESDDSGLGLVFSYHLTTSNIVGEPFFNGL